MIDLEKALETELEKLKTAVAYIEEAKESTAKALRAAEEIREAHEQWKAQQLLTSETQQIIETLKERIAALEAGAGNADLNTALPNLPSVGQPWLPLTFGAALIGVSSWLMFRKKPE